MSGNISAADAGSVRENGKSRIAILDMCYIAIFAAVIAVLAQISVPMAGGVPVTLQTFAVALAGIVLGWKKGALAAVVYLILGAVGVPVFTGLKGGLGSLIGVTGGFIVSFPLLALAAGKAVEMAAGKNTVSRIVILITGLFIGAVLNYAVGTVWFAVSTGNSIAAGIAACVAPFVLNDIIKLICAVWVGSILRRALLKAGLL